MFFEILNKYFKYSTHTLAILCYLVIGKMSDFSGQEDFPV